MRESDTPPRDFAKGISQGSQRAFADLYNLYFDDLVNKVQSILKDREVTKDLVQELFTKLWFERERLSTVEDVPAYLFILARNRCLNKLKASVREDAKRLQYLAEQETEEAYTLSSELEMDYYTQLEIAVKSLPGQQQKAYVMSRRLRRSYAEIAQEMQISKESVKKYLQLATSSIKRYLNDNKNSIVSFLLFFFFH